MRSLRRFNKVCTLRSLRKPTLGCAQSLLLPILKWLRLNAVSELCPPTMMASARISMICGLCMLPLCKKKWIWRRRSTRRCNDFRICCARNWLGFDVIQRSQWLHLGGDTMIFLLQMPPSPTCLIGSGRRFGCFLPLLPNARKISPASRWLVFSRCLQGWSVNICWSSRNWLYPVMLRSCTTCRTTLVG
jgi:hypothetical protein